MFIFNITILILIISCNCQIPKECSTNFTLETRICCPLSKFTDSICGYPNRGECQTVRIYEQEIEHFGFQDVRFQWPKQWYQQLCKCNNNYFGVSCDDCWYGWKGNNCSQRHKTIRRNILHYNDKEKEEFVKVIKALREEESEYLLLKEAYRDMEENIVQSNIHEILVNIHFFAQRAVTTKNSELCEETPHFDFAHGNIGFLTFHRHFMLIWERWSAKLAKQKFDIDNFSFPYWDWTDKNTCEVCTDDMIGGQGDLTEEGSNYLSSGSPFSDWKVYCDLFSPKTKFSINNCATCSSSSQSSKLTRRVSSIFPRYSHVNFTLSRPFFASSISSQLMTSECQSFSKALEGTCGLEHWNIKNTMHNAVHSNIVGPFSESSTSPNDPLFILHHTQVDRLFQLWWQTHPESVKKYPESTIPGHCFLCNQVGFIPIVKHKQFFVNSNELGYEYDSFRFGQK